MKADPFVALVDFTAFMVLIAVFLFVLTNSKQVGEAHANQEILSFEMSLKAVDEVEYKLFADQPRKSAVSDLEFTLWFIDAPPPQKTILAANYLNNNFFTLKPKNKNNKAGIFGLTDKNLPTHAVLSISHVDNLELIGTFMEVTIEIRAGAKTCALKWTDKLGSSGGLVVSINDKCRATSSRM